MTFSDAALLGSKLDYDPLSLADGKPSDPLGEGLRADGRSLAGTRGGRRAILAAKTKISSM